MRFFFFTKTRWQEPPRIRHQLAKLLADAGHCVEFFELPLFPWQTRTKADTGHERISLHNYKQLIHHKLRLTKSLHYLNAAYEEPQIRRILQHLEVLDSDIVVLFNYEYFFIRRIFPNNRIILIINDYFWSNPLGGFEKPLRWALAKTCRTSDRVLAVSPPLIELLRPYCKAELFFPWADVDYQAPQFGSYRNILLFWGYIDQRLDLSYVEALANAFGQGDLDYEIFLVGPIDIYRRDLKRLGMCPKIRFGRSSPLDDLPLSRVLCGFNPYKSNVTSINAATLPNKTLQELARGLPQVITGMPNFIDQPFVFRMTGVVDRDIEVLNSLRSRFDDLQPAISAFVSANSAESRLKALMDYVA